MPTVSIEAYRAGGMVLLLSLVVFDVAQAGPEWVQQTGVPGLDARFRVLRVDPLQPGTVYAGTREGTLVVTRDGGGVWQERPLSPFRVGVEPVLRIEVCPAAPFPLVVLTPTALFGSEDGGISFVRLFGVFEQEELRGMHCSVACGAWLALSSNRGVYVSSDGGLGFTAEHTPPGISADVVELSCEDGARWPALWVSQSRRLYRVDLSDSSPTFAARYPGPPPKGALPAPRGRINDLEVRGEEVWLATDRGVQRSDDGGHTWQVATQDLGRFVRQIHVAPSGVVAAVLDLATEARTPGASLNAIAIASADHGGRWTPLFAGLSQRRVRWLDHDGRGWWLATSGGLWAEAEVSRPSGGATLSRWARAALARDLPLDELVSIALRRAHLAPHQLGGLDGKLRRRCWLPVLRFDWRHRSGEGRAAARLRPFPFRDAFSELGLRGDRWTGWAQWSLSCFAGAGASSGALRSRLQPLRDRVTFTVQDAWHERQVMLHRLMAGESSVRAYGLLARIRAMEGVLSSLTGRDVE